MAKLKEVRILIRTSRPGQAVIKGAKGAREVSNFEQTGGKFQYVETLIVPEDAVIKVEEV